MNSPMHRHTRTHPLIGTTLNAPGSGQFADCLGPVNVVVTHPSGVAGTAMGLFTITSPSVSVPAPPQNLTVQ